MPLFLLSIRDPNNPSFMGFNPQNLQKNMHEIVASEERLETGDEKPEIGKQLPPKGRGRWVKRIILGALAALGLILAVCIFMVWFLLQAPQNVAAQQSFVIMQGETISDIAQRLQAQGLVRNGFIFQLLLIFQGREAQVKAGDFMLSPAMSAFRVSEVLTAKAPPERDLTVTIPEGFDVADIDARFSQEGLGEANEFLSALFNEAACADFELIEPCSRAPVGMREFEGYLFPDTYRFRKDSAPQDIAVKMFINFENKLSGELREEILRQGKSIHDIVTIASIIEREVRTDRDMKVVSGILYKRLEIGMPLQVDASVLYALERSEVKGQKTSSTLTIEDLQFDSPYNTYKYAGLPVGPISNPGLAALTAAIYPEASPYLYYLSAPDGTTVFSRTLEEHNRAKAQYLH